MAAIEPANDVAIAAAPIISPVAGADNKPAAATQQQQQPSARFTAAQDACQSFMSRFQQQKKVDPFAGHASFSIGRRCGSVNDR